MMKMKAAFQQIYYRRLMSGEIMNGWKIKIINMLSAMFLHFVRLNLMIICLKIMVIVGLGLKTIKQPLQYLQFKFRLIMENHFLVKFFHMTYVTMKMCLRTKLIQLEKQQINSICQMKKKIICLIVLYIIGDIQ